MQAITAPPPTDVTGFMLVHAACALIVGVPAVAVVRRVALVNGWMARPRADRWHREPVALHGGIGVLAALLLASVLVPSMPSSLDLSLPGAVLPGVLLLAAVGLVDDLHHLRHWTKLMLQVAGALALGWWIAQARGLGADDAAVIAAWSLVFCNSVNMLDNMDGACATAAVPCFAGVALFTTDPRVASLAGAAAGAMLAFWWWNKPQARIFLGDLGALPVGALFGALAALVSLELDAQQCEQVRPWLPAALPVMLGLPFVVDTGFVCITRAARGQNPMIGGTDHLTHRALRRGWPAAAVLVVIAALGAVGIVLAGVTVLGWG